MFKVFCFTPDKFSSVRSTLQTRHPRLLDDVTKMIRLIHVIFPFHERFVEGGFLYLHLF